MIIFHEGLPRSGKSYEAIVNQVLKYLKEKRQCFCFVDGLNFEMFSELLDIDLETLKGRVVLTEIPISEQSKHKYTRTEFNKLYSVEYIGLLFQIEEEQVLKIYDHVSDDSFVVLDELQDYFPVGTKPLDKGITKFVTQHGHRGLDILVMGQAHEDCHNLWKRRIDQLITFEKRDAVGQPNNYTWRSHKQQKKGSRFTFVPIRSGKGTYEKKYFGLYKSHVSGVDNVDNHQDDRANVFKSKAFTFYLPLFLIVFIYAIYHLYGLFTVSDTDNTQKIVNESTLRQRVSKIKNNGRQLSEQEKLKKEKIALLAEKELLQQQLDKEKERDFSHENYIKTISSQYRARLGSLVESKTKIFAYIQFLDESFHVHEELSLLQLIDLGWSYERKSYGIKLINGDTTLVVTAWPLDSTGKVSNNVARRL